MLWRCSSFMRAFEVLREAERSSSQREKCARVGLELIMNNERCFSSPWKWLVTGTRETNFPSTNVVGGFPLLWLFVSAKLSFNKMFWTCLAFRKRRDVSVEHEMSFWEFTVNCVTLDEGKNQFRFINCLKRSRVLNYVNRADVCWQNFRHWRHLLLVLM